MYDCGLGVKRDYNESAIWWKMAAEQGDSNAQYCLGRMYRYGHGVEQDAKEAFKWFKLAAEQGDTTAQSYLAMLH
jgi:TPR repeat protein